jgi:hypothetical protein
MEKFIEILKAALTKFSAINMTQYIGIASLIITSWQGANLISPAVVLLITSALTLILKVWQSSKELVSTGFSMDWSVWISGIAGMVIGFIDTFITNGDIMNWMFGDKANAALMVYMAITIILRTGFSNQSAQSVAARKLGK